MDGTVNSLGTFLEPDALSGTGSHARMVLNADQLSTHWRRCSLSSDHWAKYYALHFARDAVAGELNYAAAESTFSYLLNELFENCAKFTDSATRTVIFESWTMEGGVLFQLSNFVSPGARESFVKLLNYILEGDAETIYFSRLEENAETGRGGSGLGYLTLIKDYGVRFGFKFTDISPDSVRVDVQAYVDRKMQA